VEKIKIPCGTEHEMIFKEISAKIFENPGDQNVV
jgi:hypothetical protein